MLIAHLLSPLLAEEAPQAEPTKAETSSEENLQKTMREEALRLEIEMTRAEQKGLQAVADLWEKRLKAQAKIANQTKNLSEVLIFEKMLTSTLNAIEAYWQANGPTAYSASDTAFFKRKREEAIQKKREELGLLLDKSLQSP